MWEYRVISMLDGDLHMEVVQRGSSRLVYLTAAGAAGWELVSTQMIGVRVYFFLKRRLNEPEIGVADR